MGKLYFVSTYEIGSDAGDQNNWSRFFGTASYIREYVAASRNINGSVRQITPDGDKYEFADFFGGKFVDDTSWLV